jgi:predicted metal-dependent phosphoesterase TrpH
MLAHPMAYGMTGAWRRGALAALTDAGGDDLEVGCSNTAPGGVAAAADDARRHGLMGSVGSDFHGPEQHWLKLGRPLPLPETVPPVWEHPRFSFQE